MTKTPAKTENLKPRPPIVVVMGHVDHGKTTLLDYIRKTNVAAKEAGGITQSIGAYEIVHGGKKITFIDTPGHEAFSKMRAHGARIADLAILVVAADDGVKPQTKDALLHIQNEKIPFVVAINKIDKPNADVEKTKQELTQNSVFLEGYGGNISWQAISAKTGEGVNELLDLILLAAEMESLTYDPQARTKGIVVSGRLDPKRGLVAGIIVENGTLKLGELIATQTASGKIKMLQNFLGEPVKMLEPSAPALIWGFETLPEVGEEFFSGDVKLEMVFPEKTKISEIKNAPAEDKGGVVLNTILKSDEAGSLEVLKELVQKMQLPVPVNITAASIGSIYENDVKLAGSNDSIIVGFRVTVDSAARNLAKAQKITIITSAVIYELEKELKDYISKASLKEMRVVEILAVFGKPKGRERIVGGRILTGPIKNQEKFEIWQDKKLVGAGKVLNLQSQKKDIMEAAVGDEVGLLVESEEPIKIGHKLIFPDAV